MLILANSDFASLGVWEVFGLVMTVVSLQPQGSILPTSGRLQNGRNNDDQSINCCSSLSALYNQRENKEIKLGPQSENRVTVSRKNFPVGGNQEQIQGPGGLHLLPTSWGAMEKKREMQAGRVTEKT